MNPVATVNGVGFRRMIKEFEPHYVVPDRKTLRTNYIPKMYEHEKSHINHAIANVSSYALTTDIWSSRTMHWYMGVTIHFIDINYCLSSYLLDVKELLDNHTGENIAEHLSEIMNDWHLSSANLSGVTTDNGSNMLKAVSTLHWCHMPCFSHTLQLAVQVAMKLPAISRAIARCKRLINHFHHSVQSTQILRSKQKSLKHPQHSLMQEVSTRWNSSYYMMERIIKQQQPICATLLEIKRGDLMPSEVEFAAMESFIKILKPLVEITETMGGQKWVTISAVHPFLYKLLHISFNITSNDTPLENQLRNL